MKERETNVRERVGLADTKFSKPVNKIFYLFRGLSKRGNPATCNDEERVTRLIPKAQRNCHPTQFMEREDWKKRSRMGWKGRDIR